MLASSLFTLLAASATLAVPLVPRDVTLNPTAVAQAQVRDNTATRAFSAVTINTSDGRCLSVDPASGDFRENLTPVAAVACDGSANQTWDVITSGVHNNVPGQALIVSSLTQACLNFDPRRAAGNQVLLFSCGGRADGSGQVTNSQLFAFNGGSGPLALLPQNGNNQTCLTINSSNDLDQTNCNGAASASGLELFTFGGSASSSKGSATASTTSVAVGNKATCGVQSTVFVTVPPTATASSTTTAVLAVQTTSDKDNSKTTDSDNTKTVFSTVTATVTVTVSADCAVSTSSSTKATTTNVDIVSATQTQAAATSTGVISVAGAGGVLNAADVAQSQARDNTATRAATAVTIQDSAGQCLSVNITAGDFRENLIPVQLVDCDASDEAQQWDFITAGVHNNAANSALIVSTLMNGCLNFDPRRAAGDQVIMFSCGGRADGSGQTTNSQLFPFPANTDLTKPYVLAPENGNNAVCLVAGANGRLVNDNCSAASPAANEQWTIGGASSGSSAAASTTSSSSSETTTTPPPSTATQATSTVDSTTATTIAVAGAGGVLNPSDVAQSQPRDNTATRAATGVQLKDSAGQCLSVNITAGDFRENLIPVQLVDCDSSDEAQKWDFITKGAHNNAADSTLIVSTLMNGCLNFDPRRAAGDQVIMFSCGGRADGGGQTTNSQLFPFPANTDLTKPYVLAPENGNNAVCLVAGSNGRLVNDDCTATSPSATEQFTIVQ
ncbi:hypothetical protein HMN09_00336600 [Mycena chlorophos]|uniref:Ricin B lectin domain-containing protein n=1 Tax=Mycena chlorophos TaxID=658473 RepID=A0A8H6WMZ6_MYCCL|nr:hypothetical protein HMN09_00336600 [Mycena chlorophos]